jgi:hypothetical protein
MQDPITLKYKDRIKYLKLMSPSTAWNQKQNKIIIPLPLWLAQDLTTSIFNTVDKKL